MMPEPNNENRPPAGVSPIIISPSETHILIAVGISEAELARHRDRWKTCSFSPTGPMTMADSSPICPLGAKPDRTQLRAAAAPRKATAETTGNGSTSRYGHHYRNGPGHGRINVAAYSAAIV